ncbi:MULTISPECIES: TetR/AcrR family transcriptional regulator [Chitinophagaceae]
MESKTAIARAQIIKASRDVFQALGYNNVTMSHIATAVDMGRSSLYYYFKNKEEVFVALCSIEFSAVLDKAKTKMKATQSFYDNFLFFNKERLTSLNYLANDFQNLLDDIRENPSILHVVRKTTFKKEYEIFRQMLVWGIKRHDIASISAEDLDFLTTNIIYALKGLEQEFFLFGNIEDLTNRLDWVTSIISKGLK